jgi:hypothetical protein
VEWLGGLSYARHEVDCRDEDEDRVDIVCKLQGIQLESCEECEDAVEASDFVDEEREGDEFCCGTEGDEVEEGLS